MDLEENPPMNLEIKKAIVDRRNPEEFIKEKNADVSPLSSASCSYSACRLALHALMVHTKVSHVPRMHKFAANNTSTRDTEVSRKLLVASSPVVCILVNGASVHCPLALNLGFRETHRTAQNSGASGQPSIATDRSLAPNTVGLPSSGPDVIRRALTDDEPNILSSPSATSIDLDEDEDAPASKRSRFDDDIPADSPSLSPLSPEDPSPPLSPDSRGNADKMHLDASATASRSPPPSSSSFAFSEQEDSSPSPTAVPSAAAATQQLSPGPALNDADSLGALLSISSATTQGVANAPWAVIHNAIAPEAIPWLNPLPQSPVLTGAHVSDPLDLLDLNSPLTDMVAFVVEDPPAFPQPDPWSSHANPAVFGGG
jgi:hypothetical protein